MLSNEYVDVLTPQTHKATMDCGVYAITVASMLLRSRLMMPVHRGRQHTHTAQPLARHTILTAALVSSGQSSILTHVTMWGCVSKFVPKSTRRVASASGVRTAAGNGEALPSFCTTFQKFVV